MSGKGRDYKADLNRLLFGAGARGYDALTSHSLWFEQVGRLIARLEARLGTAPARVLDLGCGPGQSAFALAEHFETAEVVGVDLSEEMVARARRARLSHPGAARLRFVRADASALPFAAGTFDLALGHSFLYLVGNPAAVLRDVRRVVRRGGTVAFLEPAQGGSLVGALLRARRGVPHLVRRPVSGGRFLASMAAWRMASAAAGRMSRERLVGLLEEAGFREVLCEPTLGGLGWHAVARA